MNVAIEHRRLTARIVAVLALLCALPSCDYVVKPIKGVEGRTHVYAAVGAKGAPNAGIIVTSLGAIVIDPPLTPDLGNRLNNDALSRSRTFWDEFHKNRQEQPHTLAPPVLYVLNTTYRASHTFGNQAFSATADVITSDRAGKNLADINTNRKMRQVLQTQFQVPGMEKHAITEPVITFEGTLTLHTPEVEIKMISLGDCMGEGDTAIYLPQHKVLFAGDVVIPGFMPYPEGRTLSTSNWIKALQYLKTLDLDVVVPGHGEVREGKEAKALIEGQLLFLQTLRAEVNRAISAGKTEEQAAKEIKLPAYATWIKYDAWLGDNVRLVFKELSGATADKSVGGTGGPFPHGIANPDAFTDK